MNFLSNSADKQNLNIPIIKHGKFNKTITLDYFQIAFGIKIKAV